MVLPNSNINTPGRFGNHFIRNLCAHYISKNNDILFEYSYLTEMESLGLTLFKNGKNTYNLQSYMTINENDFMKYIIDHKNNKINQNIYFPDYYQCPDFSLYIYNYLREQSIMENIISHNKYNTRYDNNNNIFIHIRLDDAANWNPGFEYYDNIISKIKFDVGYIATDSPQHLIVTKLKEKYSLNLFNESPIDTIKFGSTCKHIILTDGTFSWLIGVFSFISNVYYPKNYHVKWCGDIYNSIPNWKQIDYKQ
jgi:hypothetical protein